MAGVMPESVSLLLTDKTDKTDKAVHGVTGMPGAADGGRPCGATRAVCAAAPGPAGPSAPSLSDALGTSNMPVPGRSQSGSGTLDTLTGNAIGR